MKWLDIKTHPAPFDQWLLIRYYKQEARHADSAKRYCVTEAKILAPEVILHHYPNGNTWEQKIGGVWFDYADRTICDTTAKKSKNVVTHWMPLPDEP
jgi:Protein of unknown function (DUF551)